MAVTLSLTEAQTFTALWTVLIGILPAGTEVIRAEINRVPEPIEPNFVIMSPLTRSRLGINVTTYDDVVNAGVRNDEMDTEVKIQLDIHGPISADLVQIIETLFQSQYGVDAFAATGYGIAPLYTETPRQTPFTNSEQQIEFRWSMDVALEVKPVVTTPQDFAAELVVTPTPADLTALS